MRQERLSGAGSTAFREQAGADVRSILAGDGMGEIEFQSFGQDSFVGERGSYISRWALAHGWRGYRGATKPDASAWRLMSSWFRDWRAVCQVFFVATRQESGK
jgi:hypothetical protein